MQKPCGRMEQGLNSVRDGKRLEKQKDAEDTRTCSSVKETGFYSKRRGSYQFEVGEEVEFT